MWGVPADHEMFNRVNSAQWLWYFYNYAKDQEEQLIVQRDMLEYHAGFLAPDMVDHVRKAREEEENKRPEGVIGTTDDQAFAQSIGSIFGRDPGFGDAPIGEVHDVSANIVDRMAEHEMLQAELMKTPKYNYKHWIDFDLE